MNHTDINFYVNLMSIPAYSSLTALALAKKNGFVWRVFGFTMVGATTRLMGRFIQDLDPSRTITWWMINGGEMVALVGVTIMAYSLLKSFRASQAKD